MSALVWLGGRRRVIVGSFLAVCTAAACASDVREGDTGEVAGALARLDASLAESTTTALDSSLRAGAKVRALRDRCARPALDAVTTRLLDLGRAADAGAGGGTSGGTDAARVALGVDAGTSTGS